jgi:hypothetical protein
VIQEGITSYTLNSLGVEGYQANPTGLVSSVVGAGLGGAPLAFGSRVPEMALLGGVGGALGYAGAQLIIQESGGVISDTEGNPLPIDHDLARLTPILAAATPELHEALIRSIHPD